MKTLKFNDWNCVLNTAGYINGGTALLLNDADNGEPVARATVWVPGLSDDEVAIKDYSENSGMLTALVDADIVTLPHRFVESGFVTIPVCKLK